MIIFAFRFDTTSDKMVVDSKNQEVKQKKENGTKINEERKKVKRGKNAPVKHHRRH